MSQTPSQPAAQPTESVPKPAASRPAPRPPHAGHHGIFSFFKWIFTGFGLLTILGRRSQVKIEEVTVYTVPRPFYLWAVILAGFVGCFVVRHFPNSAVVMGWIYIWVLMYTLVTLLFDLGTLKVLLWSGIGLLLWVVCKYIQDLKNIHLLSWFTGFFANMRPKLDIGFVEVLSWFMLILWLGGVFQTFARGRKRFTPNGIEEWYLGEGSEITDRSGLHFVTRYPDLFESFLGFGCGSVHAIDGTGRTIKHWDNILFLFFVWPHLEEIIEQRSATVDNAPDESATQKASD